jgi:hypothetical protein
MVDRNAGVPEERPESPEPDGIRKYIRALRRAQRDIDLRPDL